MKGPAAPRRRIAILQISNTWGGAEIHTLALTRVLAARGHSCIIVELDQPQITEHRALVPDGVEVRRVPLGLQPSPVQVYWVLRELRADVGVLSKGWTMVGSTALDLACRLALRGRFLTIEHLTPPPRAPRSSRRHLGGLVPGLGVWWYLHGSRVHRRSIFPKRVVGVSQAVARELIEDYGFPSAKVRAIANGVDGRRFIPDPAARARSRTQWGVPQDAEVFGAVGRFSNFHKGHDVAIELFARLCTANPGRPLYCVLIGTGSDEGLLRAQAQATPWSERIVFPGPTDRPWEAHCGLDVFLMTSRFEGIGLALLEAMACGCCPVVMAVGGIKDVVTEPELGWAAPAGDREAFLQGMQGALDLGFEGRKAMGIRVREHVLRHFDAEVQYGKLADLIERI